MYELLEQNQILVLNILEVLILQTIPENKEIKIFVK